MTRPAVLTLAVVAVVLLVGAVLVLRPASQPAANGTLQVTASFYPLYFFAHAIAAERADIATITPPGAEPHDYEPTPRDVARIESGQMLILNGGVESWGQRLADTLQGTGVRVVIAGQGLLNQQVVEEGQTLTDPHVWLDPMLAKQEAGAIASGFEAIDPAHAAEYRSNFEALSARLDQLDAEYRSGLARCASKDIVTSHAAFGYLASRYGLTQVTVTGVSPDAEPSAQELAQVAAFARAHHVRYIFFESLVSPKLSETIANEVGAQTLVLDPIEGLTPGAAAAGRDYFTIMADNLANLRTALQCT